MFLSSFFNKYLPVLCFPPSALFVFVLLCGVNSTSFTGLHHYFLLPQKSSLPPFSSPSSSYLMHKHSHHLCTNCPFSIHSLSLCFQTKSLGSLFDVSTTVACTHLG